MVPLASVVTVTRVKETLRLHEFLSRLCTEFKTVQLPRQCLSYRPRRRVLALVVRVRLSNRTVALHASCYDLTSVLVAASLAASALASGGLLLFFVACGRLGHEEPTFHKNMAAGATTDVPL